MQALPKISHSCIIRALTMNVL